MDYFLTCNLFTNTVEQNKTHIHIKLQVPEGQFWSEINIRIEDFTEEAYYSNFKSYIDKNPFKFMNDIKLIILAFLINSETKCLDLKKEVYNFLNKYCEGTK
jgi:hypothetical protein